MIRFFLLFITLIYTTITYADSKEINDIIVTDGWVRYIPTSSQSPAAAYMNIQNNSNNDIRLIKASAKNIAGNVELHQSFVDEKGISRMVSIDHIDIPENTTVSMKPGGIHIMLLDLQKTLKTGDIVDLELIFEHQGPIKVSLKVK